MATGITIEIKADTTGFKRDVKSALDSGSAQVREFKSALDSSTGSVNSLRSALGSLKTAFAAIGGALVLKQIGEAAIQSAISIDKTRQTMVALTGSVDAANKKIAELRELAKSSPGVTTSFATDLFVQFKALKTVADSTINDLIKSIGKLNAVFAIPDVKTFSRNLIQIFQGGFERDQIKEALQSVPIFEQLLQEAFGTSDGQKLKKLKDAGKLTMETFLQGIIEKTNERFPQVQDGIGAQFDKLKDRITVALEPLGKELVNILLPAFDDIVKKVEQYGDSAGRIFKENRDDIIATVKELATMTVQIGKLAASLADFASKSGIFKTIAINLADAADIFSGDVGFLDFFSGARGPRVQALERQFAEMNSARIKAEAFGSDVDLGAVVKATGGGNLTVRNGAIVRASATGGGNNRTGAPSATVGDAKRRTDAAAKALAAQTKEILDVSGDIIESAVKGLETIEKDLTGAIIQGNRDRSVLVNYAPTLTGNIRQGIIEAVRQRDAATRGRIDDLQRTSRRALNRSGQAIGDLFNRGAITPEQADALSQAANRQRASQLREVLALEEQFGQLSDARLDDLRDEIALYDQLGTAISDTERFMRGFNAATISVGDAFERFGQNVSQALLNTKDLLNGLKNAVLSFFNDLLGRSLQNIVRQALSPLAGLGGAFGGVFGGGGFTTPPFVPQSASGSGLQNLLASVANLGGGGLSVPASVTAGAGGSLGGLPIFRGNITAPGAFSQLPTGAAIGGAASRGGFSLGGLFGGLASAAPLLGLSLGAGLGGQSTFGNVLGAVGGGAVGLGLSFGASVFSAGGGLGSAALAALGPIALIGAPLLVGAIFAGKAAQRRKDEQASGEYLTQAIRSIEELARGVASGQIPAAQARSIFDSQILGTFRSQISSLKTKSVVESRLTNQVRDLEKVYRDLVEPAIQQQQATLLRRSSAAERYSSQIPEFASGGLVGGIDRGFDSVRAMLRPGELVLNRQQQQRVMAQAGPSIFRNAGVPGVNYSGAYANGGYAPDGGQPIEITIDAQVVISEKTATGIYVTGAKTSSGRAATVNNVRVARTNREL